LKDGRGLTLAERQVVALDDVLERVAQWRSSLQGDGLATDDAELQQSAPSRWPTADSQDPAGLASAELIQRHDGRRGRAPLATSFRDRSAHPEGAGEKAAGAVFAILTQGVGIHSSIATHRAPMG